MLDDDDEPKEASWWVTGVLFVGFVLALAWLLVLIGAIT